jgi:hypothetical protein
MLRPVWIRAALAPVMLMIALDGCSKAAAPVAAKTDESRAAAVAVANLDTPLEGMPPLLDANDIYAADRAGNLSPTVAGYPQRVYVRERCQQHRGRDRSGEPSKWSTTSSGPAAPAHHASYDLKHLWVLNDLGDTSRRSTGDGCEGQAVWVKDPYNMYYTPTAVSRSSSPSGKRS